METNPDLDRIEPARSEDLPAVELLLERLRLPLDGLSAQFPEAFVVVRDGSIVVAVAGLELYGDTAILRSVAVDTTLQRRGLGKRLVADRMAAAERSEVSRVYLLANTAYEFFLALGFKPIRRTEAPPALATTSEFGAIGPASAVCFVWSLDG